MIQQEGREEKKAVSISQCIKKNTRQNSAAGARHEFNLLEMGRSDET